jgi:hypothetical protein
MRVAHKCDEDDEPRAGDLRAWLQRRRLAAITSGDATVLGGTSWMWARPEFAGAVDVLFVDEAGQMSLANVLASRERREASFFSATAAARSAAARQRIPRAWAFGTRAPPGRARDDCPMGVGSSAVTWRLAPSLCAFTSEVFYEGGWLYGWPRAAGSRRCRRAATAPGCGCGRRSRRQPGTCRWRKSKPWRGCRQLTAPGVRWINEKGEERH